MLHTKDSNSRFSSRRRATSSYSASSPIRVHRPFICGDPEFSSRLRGKVSAGFTLIELLVVISIIVILMGLLFSGMKMWQTSANLQTTNSRMQILNNMLADLQAAGLNEFNSQWFMTQPGGVKFGGEAYALDATAFGAVAGDSTSGGYTVTFAPSAANFSPTLVAYGRANALSYMTFNASKLNQRLPGLFYGPQSLGFKQVFYSTASPPPMPQAYGILYRTASLPDIAKAIAALPNTAVATPPSTTPQTPATAANTNTYAVATPGGPSTPLPPVILDGWGNPILFVPAGGIFNLYTGPATSATAISAINNPIQSPDGRPFFVSAGPDGDFTTAADNVYSFNVH